MKQSPQKAKDPINTDILTFVSDSELNTLYSLNMDSQNKIVVTMVYETLLRYEGGEMHPLLAESWEFNEDGRELTLHLKPNVTFHDGSVSMPKP